MQRGMKVIGSGLLDYYTCVPTTRPLDGMLVYKTSHQHLDHAEK